MVALFTPPLAGMIWIGLPVMHAVLLCAAAACVILLWRRPWRQRLAAKGAVVFSAFYGSLLWIGFQLWPELVHHWNAHALSGVLILGIPAEELAWAVAYGAVWPVFIAYLLDAQPITGMQAAAASRASGEPGRAGPTAVRLR
jgi:hypothetical protein